MTAGGVGFRVVRCSAEEAARAVAAEIAALLRGRGRVVLGVAAGRSPLGVYDELARLHREQGLSFAGAEAFALDEYIGLDLQDPRSFHRQLHVALFDRVDLPRGRRHVPRGDLPEAELDEACREHERRIAAAGGLDLQLLGVGRNGHLAFNEPGAPRASRTRRVQLAARTRQDAAADFGGLEHVPREALTMGLATILEARRLRALAFGAAKEPAVRALLDGPVGEALPASFLREHPDCALFTDVA